MSLWQSPEAAPLAGFGAAPQGRPQVDVYFRRPARGESENSPVDCFWRGDALQERASPINFRFISFAATRKFQLPKRQGKFLPASLCTDNKFLRERPLLQGALRAVPFVASRHFPTPWGITSFPTVHWTVGKFTLCGAPKGCIDLRSIWDSVPNPARGAASGLCQRGIAPLETRCCRLRRFTPPTKKDL